MASKFFSNDFAVIKNELQKLVKESAKKAGLKLPQVLISGDSSFGDYSTQAALMIKNGKKPKENAAQIIKNLPKNKILKKAEEKNGFINFYLSNEFLGKMIKEIIEKENNFGENQNYKNKKIQVEFVSANPTGPLHLGNARGGPLGDVIASVLKSSGAKVEREFYVNDAGNQAKYFGETLKYWQKKSAGEKVKFPKKGYPGDYMKELAEKISKSSDTAKLAKEGIDLIVKEMKLTLARMGIKYNKFVYESEILSSGKTQKVIDAMANKGRTLVKEGAVWFGESVLTRSDKNQTPTYYANDIAYHKDKFERGFDKIVDIWGSNHYGHMPRLKQALESLGIRKEKFEIILYQYVRLKHGDKIEKMAKREGIYVTANQVLKAVGKDAFRMMMLLNSPNTHLDFDLELAKKESRENPVYYLQYACARIAGILKKCHSESYNAVILSHQGEESREILRSPSLPQDDKLDYGSKYERELAKELIKFPDLISEISRSFEVHHLPHYGISLAKKFHQFYKNCPVIKAENEEVKSSRVALIKATQIVLKNTLNLLGISVPEKM